MVIQAVGWSEDMRWGAAFTWGTTDLISRVTQMWSPLCPLFPEWSSHPWHCLSHVADRNSGLLKGEEGKA